MARPSRPPGFDMTYRPKRATFTPPWSARWPSTVFLGVVLVVSAAIFIAPKLPASSWLYRFVVTGDMTRVMSSTSFAIVLLVTAFAGFLRQQMSGVIVNAEGIETREILALGVPRIQRYTWTQIDRVRIPPSPVAIARQSADRTNSAGKFSNIRLDLWDGTRSILPEVAKKVDLSVMIERVALARAIPIEGGTGLVDELGSPFEGDEESAA